MLFSRVRIFKIHWILSELQCLIFNITLFYESLLNIRRHHRIQMIFGYLNPGNNKLHCFNVGFINSLNNFDVNKVRCSLRQHGP